MENKLEFFKRVSELQQEIKVKKDNKNSFGGYNYRNIEDICAEIKPKLNGLIIYLNDDLVNVGDRFYIKATATITDGENSISNSALAREEETKKGMDGAQITGGASSYARKYALSGLLLLENEKDSDSTNHHNKTQKQTQTQTQTQYQPKQSTQQQSTQKKYTYKTSRLATEAQKILLRNKGVKFPDDITMDAASDLIKKALSRDKQPEPTVSPCVAIANSIKTQIESDANPSANSEHYLSMLGQINDANVQSKTKELLNQYL